MTLLGQRNHTSLLCIARNMAGIKFDGSIPTVLFRNTGRYYGIIIHTCTVRLVIFIGLNFMKGKYKFRNIFRDCHACARAHISSY